MTGVDAPRRARRAAARSSSGDPPVARRRARRGRRALSVRRTSKPSGVDGARPTTSSSWSSNAPSVCRLLVEALRAASRPRRARACERHAPAVGVELEAQRVPPAPLPHALPGRRRRAAATCAARRARARGPSRPACSWMKPGNCAISCRAACVAERRADGGEHVAERVVARQHLHRRPRAAVRRAQHQDARARDAPSCARHIVRSLELHRARDQAAHRVRQHAHRLAASSSRASSAAVDRFGEPRAPRPRSAAASRTRTSMTSCVSDEEARRDRRRSRRSARRR